MRDAVTIRLLSEYEGAECARMIESRNRTPHMYHQDMAEDIAQKVPEYYTFIITVISRLHK